MPLRSARVPALTFDIAVNSVVGRVRKRNEDAVLYGPDWIVVSDGMGGAPAGDVASALAVAAAAPWIQNGRMPIHVAVTYADRSVAVGNELHPEWKGMGATLVLLRLSARGYRVAHVGDSRAYLLRAGILTRLTVDHASSRNTLTRVLGHTGGGTPDVASGTLLKGDVFLVCSDGLTSMVPDATIRRLLMEHDASSGAFCEVLVAAANKAGGHDNITVAVAQVEGG